MPSVLFCERRQRAKWQIHIKSFKPMGNKYSRLFSWPGENALVHSFHIFLHHWQIVFVISDSIFNLYNILCWFPTIHFLNIFLSFLLPLLLYFFFLSNNFSSLWTISWPLYLYSYFFSWGSVSWYFLQPSHSLYKFLFSHL